MILPPAPWPGVVASLLFIGALALLAVLARRYPGIIRSPRPTAVPQLELPPERPALPSTPLVVVLGDFYWTSQEMADDMVKAALRVARNYGELDTVRELTAARRVVKGELAS